jgi:PAS domain-containing protein
MVGQLRTRAQRTKRRSNGEVAVSDAIVDEALDLCNNLLVDFAGAETEISTLRATLQNERQDAAALFERMPIATVSTDAEGVITAANPHAAALLNVSVRHLAGKPLFHFTQDRAAFLALLQSFPRDGSTSQGALSIRPRERRPVGVAITVLPRTSVNTIEWIWFLARDVAREQMQPAPLDVPHRAQSEQTSFEAAPR